VSEEKKHEAAKIDARGLVLRAFVDLRGLVLQALL
jgi:hypothetical protein